MSNMSKPIRHGECLLLPVTDEVAGTQHTSFIIAHSETGHHHVLESKKPFTISKSDKQFLIELFEPAKLVHKKTTDKHKTLPVAPGKYKVIYKNEYNPFLQEIQKVLD
jgi:hypothetical protein